MKKVRVVVVENQAVVREGIVALLSLQSDIDVVGQAEDGIQGVNLIQQTNPDVVLLDLAMPRQDGVTTILKLKELKSESRILVLTSYSDGDSVFSAIKAGATGYMLKDSTIEQLLSSIHDVAAGKASLHPSIALKVIQEMKNPAEAPPPNALLTHREQSTLELIARGFSNQEIAAELFINERTVAKYVSSILAKLHLANRTKAALYLLQKETAVINTKK
jgi:NarL family two-component system response regulator LiaR